MAVSVDTYDEENGIHPRYKQVEEQMRGFWVFLLLISYLCLLRNRHSES